MARLVVTNKQCVYRAVCITQINVSLYEQSQLTQFSAVQEPTPSLDVAGRGHDNTAFSECLVNVMLVLL
jgi:hypothetical protein